jgi:hypothetical protein
MKAFAFLKPLLPIIAARFGAPGESAAAQIAEELSSALWSGGRVRYALVDPAGNLADRRLYENPMIAAAAAREVGCRVVTVILDEQP